jgi:hypothetical protein
MIDPHLEHRRSFFSIAKSQQLRQNRGSLSRDRNAKGSESTFSELKPES